MNKIKTITLSYPHWDMSGDNMAERVRLPKVWNVEKVTDSVEFSPNQQLHKPQVEELCASKEWKVTVVQVKS